jgi:peptide/nickel transport system substrate-binding protein
MAKAFRIVPLVMLLALILGLVPSFAQEYDWSSYSAPDCSYGGNILSIVADDPATVTFTLCAPDPAFPSKVAFTSMAIFPSEVLEATGGGGPALFENPVGTGAYMLSEWDKGNQIVMTRNENYWGTPAVESTLIFRWNAEASIRLVELQAGEADGIDNVGPTDFEIVRGDANLELLERAGANVFYVGINNTIEPFNDVRVRQALAYGIDKQRIIDNFYPAGSQAASQFMPPGIFGFTSEVEGYGYDPEMARALLEEAAAELGFTLPIETTLSFRNVVRGYLPDPVIVANDLQAQLADIGIAVTITEMESGAFLDAADAGELSLHLLGWGMDYPDATNFLDYHFGVGSSAQFGDKFEEITGPLTEAASLSDAEARYALYVEANTAIRDLVPMVPVAHGGSAVAYRAELNNTHVSPLGNESFASMEDPSDDTFTWVQNGEPAGLYCADESDGEALRVCEQINEALLAYEVGGTDVIPALAESFEANEDLTVWTFNLRQGVKFHDGSDFDAADVVASYVVQWDAAHPLHVGRDGSYTYFSAFFAGFLNPPPAAE